MPALEAHIHIAEDGTLTGRVSAGSAAGDHDATILIPEAVKTKIGFELDDLPMRDTPWDGSISLRREDMYDDDGR